MGSTYSPSRHRHSAHGQHEHEFEPQYGLPEKLPEDEHILWQGSPCWQRVAIERFHVRKVAVYFAVLLLARVVALVSDGMPVGVAVAGCVTLSAVALLALALLTLMAWMTAKTAVYTLTDKRIVMRIGIVLTMALNLPFRRVAGATLALQPGGTGDIALQLQAGDHLAYAQLWPHARRWHLARPQPTLLCLADAQRVADRLTQAWRAGQGAGAPSALITAAPDKSGRAPALAARSAV
jgi:hypothetical protein